MATLEELVRQVRGLLSQNNQTVAVAESLTGGLVLELLTESAGASLVVSGGVVAYTPEAKTKMLGVEPELIAAHTVVSAEVALAMATNVRERFGTTWGLATTGVAGPGPLGGSRPGRVFVAVVGPGVSEVAELALSGDRVKIRAISAERLLDMLFDALTAGK